MKKKIRTSEVYEAVRLVLVTFFTVVLIFRIWSVVSVQRTVKDYNALLEVAYNNMDLQPMKRVATNKELRRLQAILSNLYTREEKVETRLQRIEFLSINWGFDTLDLETKEKWFYKLISSVDGRIIRFDVYNYRLVYRLVRTGLSWKINEVNILKETREAI